MLQGVYLILSMYVDAEICDCPSSITMGWLKRLLQNCFVMAMKGLKSVSREKDVPGGH